MRCRVLTAGERAAAAQVREVNPDHQGDLAGHLRNDADSVAIPAEMRAIDGTLKARLVEMTRFGNHLCANVDDAEVYRIVREDLGGFLRWAWNLNNPSGA